VKPMFLLEHIASFAQISGLDQSVRLPTAIAFDIYAWGNSDGTQALSNLGRTIPKHTGDRWYLSPRTTS
jgi:hypothetical protein